MSRLPERGDVLAAVRVLNERMINAVGATPDEPTVFTGPTQFNISEGTIEGEGAWSMLAIYGDLFDVGDLMATGGANLVEHHIADLVNGGGGLRSSLVSVLSTGAALGVLMERHRWQNRDEDGGGS